MKFRPRSNPPKAGTMGSDVVRRYAKPRGAAKPKHFVLMCSKDETINAAMILHCDATDWKGAMALMEMKRACIQNWKKRLEIYHVIAKEKV